MKKMKSSDGWMKVKDTVASVISAPERAINWYKGKSADTARAALTKYGVKAKKITPK